MLIATTMARMVMACTLKNLTRHDLCIINYRKLRLHTDPQPQQPRRADNRSKRTDELYLYLGDWLLRPLTPSLVGMSRPASTASHRWSPANRAISLLRSFYRQRSCRGVRRKAISASQPVGVAASSRTATLS